MFGRRIRAKGDGFQLRFDRQEREVLRSLPRQVRELMDGGDDGTLDRLFPPAYSSVLDADKEAEYRSLMREELERRHREALDVLEATVDADRVDAEQLQQWMAAINQFRLVLGTALDVTEDLDPTQVPRDDPRSAGLALYGWLSWLLEQAVEALSGAAGFDALEDDSGGAG